jgi:hypothetical protein
VSARSFATFLILKATAAILLILFAWYAMQTVFATIRGLAPPQAQTQAAPAARPPTPAPIEREGSTATAAGPNACRERVDASSGTYVADCGGQRAAPSAAELRELQRRADEAAKVLEPSTPEM